jgi:hypothetical protein
MWFREHGPSEPFGGFPTPVKSIVAKPRAGDMESSEIKNADSRDVPYVVDALSDIHALRSWITA